ncbi:MAG: hypothetical protein ABIZ91_11180 [Gemmatimonadaceae bacterium]
MPLASRQFLFSRQSRREATAVAILVAIHVALVWMLRAPAISAGNDQAWYMLLARSLRHLSYENLQFVEVTPHTKFPPGYPALLSLLGITDFARLDVGIAINALLSGVALVLTYCIVRPASRIVALLTVAVSSVNPFMLFVAGSLLSEPLFMVLTGVAVWGVTRQSQSWRANVLVNASLAAAALTRPIGVTFIVATLLLWVVQRRWRVSAALAISAALTLGAWLAWSATADRRLLAGQSYIADALFKGADAAPDGAVPGVAPAMDSAIAANDSRPRDAFSGPLPASSEFVESTAGTSVAGKRAEEVPPRLASPARDAVGGNDQATRRSFAGVLARRLTGNVRSLVTAQAPTVLAIPFRDQPIFLRVMWLSLAAALCLTGAVLLFPRAPLLVVGTAAYLALLVLWPYVLLRYLVPVIPFAIALLLAGAWVVGNRLGRRPVGGHAAAGVVALLLFALAARQDVMRLHTVANCDRSRAAADSDCFPEFERSYFAAASAVRALPDDSANFLVSREALFHVLTGRHTAWEAEAAQLREPEALANYLTLRNVSYVLLSQTNFNQWSLGRPLRGLCDRLRVVGEFGPKVSLLVFAPPGAPGDNACERMARWGEAPWPESPPLIK